jgi:surface protein
LLLFGKIFAERNKDKFQIKNQELTEYLNLEDVEIKDKLIEIKLKQIKNTNDISYMFSGCKDLIEINDIYNWKTDNIVNMSGLFNECY